MAIGRPREFDPERVLDTAMRLFWARGYDGVSISDLTTATGINRRSLYAEFGSKADLFRLFAVEGVEVVGASLPG